jgi:hypothetical protein
MVLAAVPLAARHGKVHRGCTLVVAEALQKLAHQNSPSGAITTWTRQDLPWVRCCVWAPYSPRGYFVLSSLGQTYDNKQELQENRLISTMHMCYYIGETQLQNLDRHDGSEQATGLCTAVNIGDNAQCMQVGLNDTVVMHIAIRRLYV